MTDARAPQECGVSAWDPIASGIEPEAMSRFIEEQIYSLPGTDSHREQFSILLTGSRAVGTHNSKSDVDIDVVCPLSMYEPVHRASLKEGIVKGPNAFFRIVGDEYRARYFGVSLGNPHFSITSLETMQERLRAYDDVALWIWTNAKVITDPGEQFGRVVASFDGYPRDVLIRKIKYRFLMSDYWAIDVYPHNHASTEDLLAAASAIVNCANEFLRFFFLVEGRPFPYAEKLMHLGVKTQLGATFAPTLKQAVELVVGSTKPELGPWERLDQAFSLLMCGELEQACHEAMVAAGVDPLWAEADFDNIEELLNGSLGPVP